MDNLPLLSTKVHYTKVAFGKKSKSVTAHLGVKVNSYPSGSDVFWQDVQDLDLEKGAESFSANIVLKGIGGKNGPTLLGPVVQYWVRFQDGTMTVSRVYDIEVIYDNDFINSDRFDQDVARFFEGEIYRTESILISL